jgi:hypothetical protein
MDWQTIIAATIAVLAAIWAVKQLALPWIREFQKKEPAAGGCCGCGTKVGSCGASTKAPEANGKP